MRFGFFGFLIGFAIFAQDGQAQSAVQTADGALLRGLDKVSGDIQDFPLRAGSSFDLGALNVALSECRYPVDNPMGDAFAYITISEDPLQPPVFMGWMVRDIFSFPMLGGLKRLGIPLNRSASI